VRRPRRLAFPLFVKSVSEHASLGIAQASVVQDDPALEQRVRFIHEKVETDALAEEYIEGRELYVGVLGNRRLQVLPVWEMIFKKMPEGAARIATARVKWDLDYQKKRGIETKAARDLPADTEARIVRLCRRIYRALNMSGFGRLDLRLRPDGRIFVLEANPNPNLEKGEDLAASAATAGLSYEALLERILRLGLRYRAPWTQNA
jgi:D-alanine-D-alanine ligase